MTPPAAEHHCQRDHELGEMTASIASIRDTMMRIERDLQSYAKSTSDEIAHLNATISNIREAQALQEGGRKMRETIRSCVSGLIGACVGIVTIVSLICGGAM